MKYFTFTGFAAVLLLASCSNNNSNAVAGYQKTIDSLTTVISADHSSDVAALMAADSLWSLAANTKGVEGFLSYYAEGAMQLPPNSKILTTKEEIERASKGLYAMPGVSISWKAKSAEVSRSGELGYLIEEYTINYKDAKGKPVTEVGKSIEVWKKQADGSWKCTRDMWSPNGK